VPRPPATRRSTPKLSDLAKHVAVPQGVVATGWPAVEAKCRELGITFRPWQPDVGRLILAKRADGKYAATIGGTGLSIPRQVGKTFLVGAIVFALCLLFPNLTVIWTAHRVRTAEETFGKMQAFAKRKKIKPHVLKVVLGSGEEAVLFRNGSRILFGARATGFGLGFDEVDVLIFDEAQRLKDGTLDDMVPATNQSRQPTSALLLFMGTPPRPTDPGEAFTRMRTEALSGEDPDTAWVEFGADDGHEFTPLPEPLSEADWAQIAKGNPSFPDDTPREAILRMRKKLGPDSFTREGAGIWDDPEARADTAIDVAAWARLANPKAKKPGRATIVLDVAPDRSKASIGIGAAGRKGRTLIATHTQSGTAWVVPKLAKLREKREIAEVALHPGGQAAVLIPELVAAGIEFETLTSADMGRACAWFLEQVHAEVPTLEHLGQPELDLAVTVATTTTRGEAELWDRKDRTVNISCLVAGSTAAYRWSLLEGADYDVMDSIY